MILAIAQEFFGQVFANVIDQHANRRFPRCPVPAQRQRLGHAFASGIERRFGLDALKRAEDHFGVTVDVGPHLQHRNAAVAAGQRVERGARGDGFYDYGCPIQLLVTQSKADFLGKGREIVVVQNDVGHRVSSLGLPTFGVRLQIYHLGQSVGEYYFGPHAIEKSSRSRHAAHALECRIHDEDLRLVPPESERVGIAAFVRGLRRRGPAFQCRQRWS